MPRSFGGGTLVAGSRRAGWPDVQNSHFHGTRLIVEDRLDDHGSVGSQFRGCGRNVSEDELILAADEPTLAALLLKLASNHYLKLVNAHLELLQNLANAIGIEGRTRLVGEHDGFVRQADLHVVDAGYAAKTHLGKPGAHSAGNSRGAHRDLLHLSGSLGGGRQNDRRQKQHLVLQFHPDNHYTEENRLPIAYLERDPAPDHHDVQDNTDGENRLDPPGSRRGRSPVYRPNLISERSHGHGKEQWLEALKPQQTCCAQHGKQSESYQDRSEHSSAGRQQGSDDGEHAGPLRVRDHRKVISFEHHNINCQFRNGHAEACGRCAFEAFARGLFKESSGGRPTPPAIETRASLTGRNSPRLHASAVRHCWLAKPSALSLSVTARLRDSCGGTRPSTYGLCRSFPPSHKPVPGRLSNRWSACCLGTP